MERLLKRLHRLWTGRAEPPPTGCPHPVPTPDPHEQYPQIMHWQKGDEIRSTENHNRFWFNLISITADGMVYGQNRIDDHKFAQRLWVVMRDGINLSLQDRHINEALKQSDGYMELVAEFNRAFAELQERDKKLKLVG